MSIQIWTFQPLTILIPSSFCSFSPLRFSVIALLNQSSPLNRTYQCLDCGYLSYYSSTVSSISRTPLRSARLMNSILFYFLSNVCSLVLILIQTLSLILFEISSGLDSTLHAILSSFDTLSMNTEPDFLSIYFFNSIHSSSHNDLLHGYLWFLWYSDAFLTYWHQQISSNQYLSALPTSHSNSYCSVIKTHFKSLITHLSSLSQQSPVSISHSIESPFLLFPN